MRGRGGLATLVALVVALGALLLAQRPWEARLVSFSTGTPTCDFDLRDEAAVIDVPLTVSTRGRVDLEVRAELFDRTDPERQPFVDTRRAAFDTDGERDQRTLHLRIPLQQSQWAAGQDRCVVTYDTARD